MGERAMGDIPIHNVYYIARNVYALFLVIFARLLFSSCRVNLCSFRYVASHATCCTLTVFAPHPRPDGRAHV